ncbi:MAG: bifunctional oligoribonuclease/PAP phosphatase NrnA [Chlorobi bacterium]|nr:bifunctional oligoribonuclease/PAP phosphatase NrnA [Chlorobiota bacterium]
MLTKQQLDEINGFISDGNKIVITTHTNPDGDAVGSSLAVYHYLMEKGAEVTSIVPNKFPGFYNWLSASNEIIVFETEAKKAKKALLGADLIFCLDYNAVHRLGAMADLLRTAKGKKILIDHHVSPELESFDYVLSDINTSSTGELVYDFIVALGDEELIDSKVAECLYTCIITDTGSFSHSCNNPKTYEVMAKLVRKGIDARRLHGLIYDTFSENRLRLLGFAINDRMLVWEELKTALIYLTKDDLKKYNYQVGDTEGVVNFALSMEKVNLAVLVTEKDKKIRLSFRSKGDFSVNDLAREHFNGGGHRNAAGGNLNLPIMDVIDKIRSVLGNYRTELNSNNVSTDAV